LKIGYWLVGLLLLPLLASCVAVPPPISPLPAPPSAAVQQRNLIPLAVSVPGKLGLTQALDYRSCAYLTQFGATWHYDWSPNPLKCEGSDGVPMLWAPDDGPATGQSEYLLVGNECDRADQCNTSPEAAAVWWRQVEQQYPDRKLVGPNILQTGMKWLLAWHAAYERLYGEPPRLWALGVHCYRPLEECKTWVDKSIALAQQWTQSGKIWLTEWAMTRCYYDNQPDVDGKAQALTDADMMLKWLEANPNVERAAYFIARLDSGPWHTCEVALIGPDGALTDFGNWYAQAVGPQ
jgi:hypothetical protein